MTDNKDPKTHYSISKSLSLTHTPHTQSLRLTLININQTVVNAL